MELVGAKLYRDGGTTTITINRNGKEETFTMDYSLPLDNRPRYIYRGQKSEIKDELRLEIKGQEEKDLYQDIRSFFEDLFGEKQIMDLLASIDTKKRPPEEGNLFYALNFLILMEKERKFGKKSKFEFLLPG